MHTFQHARKQSSSVVKLGLLIAAGAVIGLLIAPKNGASMRNSISSTIKKIAHKFKQNSEELRETVKNIFGEVSTELEKDYTKVRNSIFNSIDEMEDLGGLTRKKFDSLVEGVVDDYAEAREWSRSAKHNLISSLKDEWESVQSHLTSEERQAA